MAQGFTDKGFTASGGGSGGDPLTIKGDIMAYDTDADRVPIGTDDQVLTVDSTTGFGLKWADATGGGSDSVFAGLTVNKFLGKPYTNTTPNGSYPDQNVVYYDRGGTDDWVADKRILTNGHVSFEWTSDFAGQSLLWGGAPGTVEVRIDAEEAVGGETLRTWFVIDTNGQGPSSPEEMKCEWSDNDSDWTLVENLTGKTSIHANDTNQPTYFDVDVSSEGEHQYWRLTYELGITGNWLAISQIQLWGLDATSTMGTLMFDLLHSKKTTADTPDDEFNAATLDGKWTAVTGSLGTVDLAETGEVEKFDLTTRPGWLLMQAGSVSGQSVELRQDFTIADGTSIVMALITGAAASDGDTGVVAGENNFGISINDNDTNYDAGTYLRVYSNPITNGVRFLSYDGSVIYGSTANASSEASFVGGALAFIRITRTGTTYRFYVSTSGLGWQPLGTKVITPAPTNLWVWVRSGTSGEPIPIHAVKWIRQGTNDIDPWNPNAAVAVSGLGEVPADSWLANLFTRPSDETSHADDLEFGDAISGTAVTVSGSATWTQKSSVLSVTASSQSADDAAARLYPLTPSSAPVTIETAISLWGVSQNWIFVGIVLTDGTVAGSNSASCSIGGSSSNLEYVYGRVGTLTDLGGTSNQFQVMNHGTATARIYLRIIWSATDTFKVQTSLDGVTWRFVGLASMSKTLTPTHYGVFISSWGGSGDIFGSYEYVRVTESDLSL